MDDLPTGIQLGPEQGDDPRAFERLLASVTCSVVRGGWYEFPPAWRVTRRVPPYSIVFLVVAGAARVQVGDHVYDLVPGTVVLAPPDVDQEVWNEADVPVRMHTVAFSARLYGLLDMPSLYGVPVEQRLSPVLFDAVVLLVRNLVRALAERDAGYALVANAACLELVAILWRSHATAAGTSDGNTDPALAGAPMIGQMGAAGPPPLRPCQPNRRDTRGQQARERGTRGWPS